MKPLIVLLVIFLLATIVLRLLQRKNDIALAARIAMSMMLVFTAIGHFAYTKGMAMMIPAFFPYKTGIVYLTGIIEIVAAIGLLVPSVRRLAAWFLIFYFILILPANIYAAIHHIDYQKATFEGPGLNYLWFRIPLQILFIGWTYFSSIKVETVKAPAETVLWQVDNKK